VAIAALAPGRAPGKIVFVHGASSSGKSTLCRALQASLGEPFWHYSIDHFRDTGTLPDQRIASGEFSWANMRPAFFEGFHRCLPALACAGNNLLVEHIIEEKAWLSRLVRLLGPFDVFFVGLHCTVAELERREMLRGDRPLGDAARDHDVVHALCLYDVEVDSTRALEDNVRVVLAAWEARTRPGALERMLEAENAAMPGMPPHGPTSTW
jgi:chloramphenicol 3-O phosphotransferase